MLYVSLVILHALVAIVWFALSLRLQAQAKLAADPAMPRAAWAAGTQTVTAMTIAAVVFYALAVGLFFHGGGFRAYTPAYHAALTLGLVLVLVQVLVVQPAWTKLAEAGGEAVGKARKRLAMGLGIGHLLWLLLFVLMFSGPKWQVYVRSGAPAAVTTETPAPGSPADTQRFEAPPRATTP